MTHNNYISILLFSFILFPLYSMEYKQEKPPVPIYSSLQTQTPSTNPLQFLPHLIIAQKKQLEKEAGIWIDNNCIERITWEFDITKQATVLIKYMVLHNGLVTKGPINPNNGEFLPEKSPLRFFKSFFDKEPEIKQYKDNKGNRYPHIRDSVFHYLLQETPDGLPKQLYYAMIGPRFLAVTDKMREICKGNALICNEDELDRIYIWFPYYGDNVHVTNYWLGRYDPHKNKVESIYNTHTDICTETPEDLMRHTKINSQNYTILPKDLYQFMHPLQNGYHIGNEDGKPYRKTFSENWVTAY